MIILNSIATTYIVNLSTFPHVELRIWVHIDTINGYTPQELAIVSWIISLDNLFNFYKWVFNSK